MKSLNLFTLYAVLAAFGFILLGAFTPPHALGESDQTLIEDQALVLQGKVREVSPENNELAVKPDKGEWITVVFDDFTKIIGFTALKELEKKQRVKVWYIIEGTKNKAVKVEKLPELGC